MARVNIKVKVLYIILAVLVSVAILLSFSDLTQEKDIRSNLFMSAVYSAGELVRSVLPIQQQKGLTKDSVRRGISSTNPCTSECSTGATRCFGSSMQTCGNFDPDTCLEWGPNEYCPLGCFEGACQEPVCGNNVIEGSEICDGSNLNDQTCSSLGYASGNLACLSDCSGYDTSSCETGELSSEFNISPNPVQINDYTTFTALAPPEEVFFYIWSLAGPWQCYPGLCGPNQQIRVKYTQPGTYNMTLQILLNNGTMLDPVVHQVEVIHGLEVVGGLSGYLAVPEAIAKSGNTIWVVADPGKLVTADVSDPTNPTFLAQTQVLGNVAHVATDGQIAAVSAGSAGIYLFDATTPSDLTPVKHYNTYQELGGQYAFGATPYNDYVYIVGGTKMVVLDISDIQNPQVVFNQQIANYYFKRVWVIDGVLYGEAETVGSVNPVGVVIMDISNPEVPSLVGFAQTGPLPIDIDIKGNLLGVAIGNNGVLFFDISNPQNPQYLSTIFDVSEANGVTFMGEYAYVSRTTTVHEIDISNPANPVVLEGVSVGPIGTYAFTLLDDEEYIYVSIGQGVVAVIEPLSYTN